MKRVFACFLAVCLMAGCSSKAQTPATIPSHQTVPSEEEAAISNVALNYDVQYIRTNGYTSGAKYPQVQIIPSKQALDDYYTANRNTFNLERTDSPYADTIGFLDACDRYNAAFFEKNYLIFLILEEGSGSVRHNVHRVEMTADGKIEIAVDSVLPGGFGTDDMGHWHLILELSKEAQVNAPGDIVLYHNGALAWNGAAVNIPSKITHRTPPQGILWTHEINANLRLGGYSWFYTKNGQTSATTADQSQRPIEKLKPVTISNQYAESVYMPVAGSADPEPTNMRGYRIMLGWDTYPTSITVTCWPDTVLHDSSTPAQEVVSTDSISFYAKPGGYIYEIQATWDHTIGIDFHGTANYYVYIIGGGDHQHTVSETEQTVDDPIIGYCGNTQTTVYLAGIEYTFMYGHSVTLTDILANLDYDPEKLCDCMAEFRVDTEFGTGYGVNLSEGYARCEKGQADLTQEQIDKISEIIQWIKATGAQYDN